MGKMIADRVAIARRYVRAVDLARDYADPSALEGYVLTPSARDALIRIVRGLAATSTQKAFRVTGPYGCGKSSFGVLLAQLFHTHSVDQRAAALARSAEAVEEDLPNYQPLVIVGRRTSITDELLHAILRLSSDTGDRPSAEFNARATMLITERSAGNRDIGPALDLVSSFAAELHDAGSGLLLLVDEMGRFIEYAAANPAGEDPSVFQQLAERAGGNAKGLAVVAFLHNRFADYVVGLGEWMEGEWSRSGERYEELAFQEPAEQSLFLLADALQSTRKHAAAVTAAAASLYDDARKRGVFPSSAASMKRASASLYPLHPATIAALVACSRRLGQNERSTFSFLQSYEPAGLQRYMGETAYGPDEWYRLDRLFDYLAAQGDVRFRSPDKERRWHLALDALALAADLDETSLAALKALAILSVLEPLPGLSADAGTIAWTLGRAESDVLTSLGTLMARGLIHRRAGRQDFSLWSSSSVDLEDWLQQARAALPQPKRLSDVLLSSLTGRPIIAHRHYQETGTLRTFSVVVGQESAAGNGDGCISIVPLYPDEDHGARLVELKNLSRQNGGLHLLNLRRVLPADLALAHDLSLWMWVRENCPELRIDDLARGEVQRRITNAQTALEGLLSPLSRPDSADNGTWIQNGEILQVPDRRLLSRLLSDTCDTEFDKSPILKNELINRSKLSTAIAAARMRLLERMLSASEQAYLGLDGAPPERTIYLSLFHLSGLHRESKGTFGFHPPTGDDPMRWSPVWRRIGDLLEKRGSMRFDELSMELASPPYGLRAGPAMLILTAFMLANKRSVAIMERGTFQPELTPAHFMRLAKNPTHFALRHVGHAGERQQVLEALSSRLGIWPEGQRPEASIKPLVQGIFGWFNKLSDYSSKTASVSPLARDVRSVLRKAREPIDLLFVDLPRTCGALDEHGKVDADQLVEKLDLALTELSDAEPKLRRQVEAATLDAFTVRKISDLRDQIRLDYGPHLLQLRDYRLRSFVDRVMKDEMDELAWLDSIASLLAGRRLSSWDDQALDRFTFETRDLAQRLARWLALARVTAAQRSTVAGVHLTSTDGSEKTIFVRRSGEAHGRSEVLQTVRGILAGRTDADVILAELFAELAETPAEEDVKQ